MVSKRTRTYEFEELPPSVQRAVAPLRSLEPIEGEAENIWYRRAKVRNDVEPTVHWGEQDFLRIDTALDRDRMPPRFQEKLWTRKMRWGEGFTPSIGDLLQGNHFNDFNETTMTLAYNPLEYIEASMYPLNISFWLVTAEIREFLLELSPEDFAFIEAPFLEDGGTRGPCYLMDVTIGRDVIDLARSSMSWRRIYQTKRYCPQVTSGFAVLSESIGRDIQAFRVDVNLEYICLRRELVKQLNEKGAMLKGNEFGFVNGMFQN